MTQNQEHSNEKTPQASNLGFSSSATGAHAKVSQENTLAGVGTWAELNHHERLDSEQFERDIREL
jgi:hypothetical protein